MYASVHIPQADPSAHDALIALADLFAPQVEVAGQGTVVFSIAGLGRLMGAPNQIASEIARRGQERGLQGNIAVAAHPDTAILAACHCRGVTLIPLGQEQDVLGMLRITSLPFGEETKEILQRWGVRTLGEFCALPEVGVMERLGTEGVALLKLARGERSRPLRVERAAISYEERIELDHPVALLEPLLFPISRLLSELSGRLREQSMATSEIRFTLELEDRSEQTRILQLPFATRDARALLKLLQLELEAHPARGAVTVLRMMLKPVEARVIQHGLYAPPAPEPEKLELTLSKIRGLVGQENAGSPALIDTHRPDAWRMRVTPPGVQTLVYEERAEPVVRLAFRYFRPVRTASVDLRDGVPVRVVASGLGGRVVDAAGPWYGSGDWWSPEGWARGEWDVQLEDGGLYRLCVAAGHWFLEGVYD